MENPAAHLTSYVDGDEWVCIFCTTRNSQVASHCRNCALSYRGGVPELDRARRRPSILAHAASPAIEFSLAAGLFAIWKLGDIATGTDVRGAVDRGRGIWHVERQLRLPSEAGLQNWVLPHRGILHALDSYYAVAHLGCMAALAGWLAVKHRESYPRWRTAVIATTAVCFLLQLVSVAPPRLVSGLGVVDTARRDGESVYGHAHFANQVSSMPSVHMTWALLVAVAVCSTGRTRRRWLSILHPVLTLMAIVLTGNHYWLDAAAAAAVTAAMLKLTRPLKRTDDQIHDSEPMPRTTTPAPRLPHVMNQRRWRSCMTTVARTGRHVQSRSDSDAHDGSDVTMSEQAEPLRAI